MRVVLLGYDKLLPDGAEAAAVREVIRPIGRPELQKCFEDTALHLQRPVHADLINGALDRILAGQANERVLADISRAVMEEAQRLFPRTPNGGS